MIENTLKSAHFHQMFLIFESECCENMLLTDIWSMQHPDAGQNKQQVYLQNNNKTKITGK